MGLQIDWGNQLVLITSPTTQVDGQVLHDFIEDEMATPVGLTDSAIIQPEGKIEDPTNPGVYSQIILYFNSPWQCQFWGGSGYTRIYGAKVIGGLNDQPMKATGTAGDITVLESPVDGLVVATEAIVPAADIADEVWLHVDAVTMMDQLLEVMGLNGENVKWTNPIHNVAHLLTSVRITAYTDNTLVTPRKAWDVTATYDGDGEIIAYQMVVV